MQMTMPRLKAYGQRRGLQFTRRKPLEAVTSLIQTSQPLQMAFQPFAYQPRAIENVQTLLNLQLMARPPMGLAKPQDIISRSLYRPRLGRIRRMPMGMLLPLPLLKKRSLSPIRDSARDGWIISSWYSTKYVHLASYSYSSLMLPVGFACLDHLPSRGRALQDTARCVP